MSTKKLVPGASRGTSWTTIGREAAHGEGFLQQVLCSREWENALRVAFPQHRHDFRRADGEDDGGHRP